MSEIDCILERQDAITPPPARWRNKWRTPDAHPVCMVTGLPLLYAGEPDTYWSLVTWPSKDVAKAMAGEAGEAGEAGDEYMGAYPCP